MKKILSLVFILGALFLFAPNVYATQPGAIGYNGPEEVTQGETVVYTLTMRDGNVFYMLMEESMTETLEYDDSVFEFISFSSDIEGISAEQHSLYGSYIYMQVLKEAAGPYESDDIIGTITFKVLDDATLGSTVLVAPGSEFVSNQYKVVNVLSSENSIETVIDGTDDLEIETEETNQSLVQKLDDNSLYIIFGSLLSLNIMSLITVIILISRKKK